MTDLVDSDNIGMHVWINFVIYLRTYIWAEFELWSCYTHLISALVFHSPQIYVRCAKVKSFLFYELMTDNENETTRNLV